MTTSHHPEWPGACFAGWVLASAAVAARMSGLPREAVARFLDAAATGG